MFNISSNKINERTHYVNALEKSTSDYPAVEQLLFQIPADQLDSYFIADANTWTAYLETVPGYGGKIASYDAS